MRYPTAVWVPSPNYTADRDGQSLTKLVLHQTDGQPRLDRAVEHLCNPTPSSGHRVSAHFLVGQAGEVVQLVDTDDTAWHCSGWNHESIGIEHVARTPGELGHDDPGLPLTEPQLNASAALVRWLLQQYPNAVVLPHCASPTTTHHDCGRDAAVGGIWPWAQYRAMLGAQS